MLNDPDLKQALKDAQELQKTTTQPAKPGEMKKKMQEMQAQAEEEEARAEREEQEEKKNCKPR